MGRGGQALCGCRPGWQANSKQKKRAPVFSREEGSVSLAGSEDSGGGIGF